MSFMESLFLVAVVYLIFVTFFYKNSMDMEGMSAYECGFEPSSYTRLSFSYRFFFYFYLVYYFWCGNFINITYSFFNEKSSWFMNFYYFLMVLAFGLVYEYMCGSLDWLEVS